MIASRRSAHRLLITLLAPLSILVFVIAIRSRVPDAIVTSLPLFAHSDAGDPTSKIGEGHVLWTKDDLFSIWPTRIIAYQGRELEVKPLRPIVKPDVLLYWTSTRPTGASLPPDAHLLGKIGNTIVRRFALPDGHRDDELSATFGSLVLYSLGHQEVLDSAVLP